MSELNLTRIEWVENNLLLVNRCILLLEQDPFLDEKDRENLHTRIRIYIQNAEDLCRGAK